MYGERFTKQATFETLWLVLQKPINALSKDFGEQLENTHFLVSKLCISTYIRGKLEQTLNICLMPTKLMFTHVGWYCDSKFAIVENKVHKLRTYDNIRTVFLWCMNLGRCKSTKEKVNTPITNCISTTSIPPPVLHRVAFSLSPHILCAKFLQQISNFRILASTLVHTTLCNECAELI